MIGTRAIGMAAHKAGKSSLLGQGFRANATIGRALQLILLNIGGARPGEMDRATQGSPAKYTFCFGENEEESPWEPFHVRLGYAADESVVTLMAAEGPHNINDHASVTGEGPTRHGGALARGFHVFAALLLALLMNRKMRGQSVIRVLIFVPYVIAEVVVGTGWSLMLQSAGAVNDALEKIGLGFLANEWLSDPDIAIWTLMLIITWKYIGFAVIIFLAGLQGIPQEIYEAAQIDGASYWQIQRRITLPLLGPTIRIWAFLSMIGSLQLFDMVWILTGGGPANATTTMATFLVNEGTKRQNYGIAAAASVVLFVIALAMALLYQRFVLARDVAAADVPRGVR